jgi:hypothetical protein
MISRSTEMIFYGIFVIDENAASIGPQIPVSQSIVYEYVAFARMLALIGCQAGDDPGTRKMLSAPPHRSRGCPVAPRQTGQDNRIEASQCLEQRHRVRSGKVP